VVISEELIEKIALIIYLYTNLRLSKETNKKSLSITEQALKLLVVGKWG